MNNVRFIHRITSSIGTAASFIGLLTLIVENFNDELGKMFAIAQLCFGLGSTVGPIIGGGLYLIGGFMLPFEVVGGKNLKRPIN